ncbi:hypothetical protein HDU87_004503, partial [Geranomyces variabilis]
LLETAWQHTTRSFRHATSGMKHHFYLLQAAKWKRCHFRKVMRCQRCLTILVSTYLRRRAVQWRLQKTTERIVRARRVTKLF